MNFDTQRVTLDYKSDFEWKLYNGDSLELCSESYKLYSDLFSSIYKPMAKIKPKILIIGGGDRQLSKIVRTNQERDFTLDIVDPLVEEFLKFSSILGINSYTPSNVQLHATTFLNWVEDRDSFETEYDQIIIDCSESLVEETQEIYNKSFPKYLSNLLSSFNYSSEIYLYVPEELYEKTSNEFLISMFRTFEIQSEVRSFIPSWGESATFMKFCIKAKYHVHYTATVYLGDSNSVTKPELLLNNNHKQFLELLENILVKYDFDIKVRTSFPFPTGGHSGSFILGESHCNWHTFPESNFFQIDIYHCKYNPGMDSIFKDLAEDFLIKDKDCSMSKNLFNPLLAFKKDQV